MRKPNYDKFPFVAVPDAERLQGKIKRRRAAGHGHGVTGAYQSGDFALEFLRDFAVVDDHGADRDIAVRSSRRRLAERWED